MFRVTFYYKDYPCRTRLVDAPDRSAAFILVEKSLRETDLMKEFGFPENWDRYEVEPYYNGCEVHRGRKDT
jgi:hypothetical protein